MPPQMTPALRPTFIPLTTMEPNTTEQSMISKTFEKVEGYGEEAINFAAKKSHIPVWGVVLVLIAIFIGCCCGCCFFLRNKWKKFKNSDRGKGLVKGLAKGGMMGKFVSEKVCGSGFNFILLGFA